MSCSNRSLSDLDFINLETILDIEKDIDPDDMTSLMFLLYEDPEVALKNLLVYQQLVADTSPGSSGLLYEWAAKAHTRKSWKWELLEALATCQLYTVIRKLGFHKQTVVKLFLKDNEISNYINPLRKILYRICENLDGTSYKCFKQIISSDFVNIPDHKLCEILFLELLRREFFRIVPSADDYIIGENVRKLLQILQKIPNCKILCTDLMAMSNTNEPLEINVQINHPVPSTSIVPSTVVDQGKKYMQDFEEEFQLIDELTVENLYLENLKTDDKSLDIDCGLCYIINQDNFTLDSTDQFCVSLENRPESTADKLLLEKTMRDHFIEVMSHDNLSRKDMFDNIPIVVKTRLKKHHRFFILCILSHGSKDHVYSAYSERVNIFDIEDKLDSDIQLRDMPKVLIVQACQTDDITLKSDSTLHYIKRSDMITFCSTAPGYDAYRIRGVGSIFIDRLCYNIEKYSNEEHLADLFTVVTRDVKRICTGLKVDQLPIILRNTLTTKIKLRKRQIINNDKN